MNKCLRFQHTKSQSFVNQDRKKSVHKLLKRHGKQKWLKAPEYVL